MPRENRKRGKKHHAERPKRAMQERGSKATFRSPFIQDALGSPTANAGPSCSISPPFGPVNPDIKAYFKTVDNQLRDWQDEGVKNESGTDVDVNEERRIFFAATLAEMNGNELQLATDPDCSPVLERMLYSMDDFVRRVFADSLAGSWPLLITDRFASHVCQTLLTVAADTVTRENRGVLPVVPCSSGKGELLTLSQLILNACEDILQELTSLVQNPFASHVLRALLLLLAPAHLTSSDFRSQKHVPFARSRKSALWKAQQGPMKAVIPDESHTSHTTQPGPRRNAKCIDLSTPDEFLNMASRILRQFRDSLGGNEMRVLAVSKVASPVLQMLIELEAAMGIADTPGSIMDCVLDGLITNPHVTPSPWVSSLFLDPTSSHLSESILSVCSPHVFVRLWQCYFSSDLPRLATHPVANFVVARGVRRLDAEWLKDAITQLHSTWSKMLKLSRIGVLIAVVDRAGQLGTQEAMVVEAICSTFKFTSSMHSSSLLSCVLRLKAMTEYQDTLTQKVLTEQDGDHDSPNASQARACAQGGNQGQIPLIPEIQGSILLQSVLRLHEPHSNIVLESLFSLPPAELLSFACNVTSSRILDVAFESSTVSLRSCKRLVQSFIGMFHLLVDDRIGSRVADRCWETADPYLKEKIARSLLPHEQFLTGSHYGRFFTPNLSLHLLRRDPVQWKAMQSRKRNHFPPIV